MVVKVHANIELHDYAYYIPLEIKYRKGNSMTQEEKELLLKDLCGRLLYQPNLQIYYEDMSGSGVFVDKLYEIDIEGPYCNDSRRLEDIKPYLRPMSSMTEEEERDWWTYKQVGTTWEAQDSLSVDWLNAHHFDYRGLIPIGLALEAPEDMYQVN